MRYAKTLLQEPVLISRLTIAVILILAITGSAWVFFSTAYSPWGYSDSAEYIGTARNLLAGEGLGTFGPSGNFHPLIFHPPLYPLVLSFLGLFLPDLIGAARWLDILLFAVVIAAAGLFTYRITKSSWLAIILSLITLLLRGMLYAYTGIMSEPLHHTLAVVSLMLIALYLHSGKLWSLILSSIFASLAVGTRFVGLVVLITGVLAILLLSRNTFKNKILNSILYGTIGILPLVTWLAWVIVNYGNEVRRSYSFNMNLWERFGPIRLAFIEAIYSWVPVLEWIKLPGGYNQKKFIVPVVIIILVGIFAVVVWKSIKNGQDQGKSMTGVRFMGVFAIFTVTYVVFYTLAYMFNNPQPDLIERLLFPIYLGAVYTMFILLWTGAQAWDSRRAIPALALAFALLFCVTDFQPNLSLSRQLNATGEGYTGVRWRNSGVLSVAQEIPEDVPLISNEFSAIHLLLNRKTYGLSELITQKPSLSFTRFGDNPSDSAERAFREDGAALILFDVVRWQFDALYPNQAEDRMKALVDGLYLYNDTYDGTIYFYEKPDWLVEP